MNITQWGRISASIPSWPADNVDYGRYDFFRVGLILVRDVHREMFIAACGHLCGTVSFRSEKCCTCRPSKEASWDVQCPICLERVREL